MEFFILDLIVIKVIKSIFFIVISRLLPLLIFGMLYPVLYILFIVKLLTNEKNNDYFESLINNYSNLLKKEKNIKFAKFHKSNFFC